MKVELLKVILLGTEIISWLSSVNVESCSLAGGPPETEPRKKEKFRRDLGATTLNVARARGKTIDMFDTTTTEFNPTKERVEFDEDCESITYYCMRGYNTGILCARSLNSTYTNFQNYCMLDYVNCMERYEMWHVMHMGECFDLKELEYYIHYRYENDYWLDQYYLVDNI